MYNVDGEKILVVDDEPDIVELVSKRQTLKKSILKKRFLKI